MVSVRLRGAAGDQDCGDDRLGSRGGNMPFPLRAVNAYLFGFSTAD